VGNVIGYARVSTIDQNLDSQLDALRNAGAARIFTDKLLGSTTARPQLQACLAYLNPGDVLAVYSTDRLGRSIGDLIEIVGELRKQGIQFKSLTEPFDTTDHGGSCSSTLWQRSRRCNGGRSARKSEPASRLRRLVVDSAPCRR
jgi:DNA invertase Pin-like site-specific DNA recombinase